MIFTKLLWLLATLAMLAAAPLPATAEEPVLEDAKAGDGEVQSIRHVRLLSGGLYRLARRG